MTSLNDRFIQDSLERIKDNESREDTLVGEIVRFLMRADKVAFAKIYAIVKAEEVRMDERSNTFRRQLMAETSDSKDEDK